MDPEAPSSETTETESEKEAPLKKRGSRMEVWSGIAETTRGGLRKEDLMVNKRGKIVSVKMHKKGVVFGEVHGYKKKQVFKAEEEPESKEDKEEEPTEEKSEEDSGKVSDGGELRHTECSGSGDHEAVVSCEDSQDAVSGTTSKGELSVCDEDLIHLFEHRNNGKRTRSESKATDYSGPPTGRRGSGKRRRNGRRG